ncbi:MAG: PHP domain-containing protein [Firmicutes bacterium]|nr:PHP domain-containing protein [Bacillota bacterium]
MGSYFNPLGSIDLHMHTTVSDGTDTPAEIYSRVQEEGIVLFSITDHDAVKGCRDILSMQRTRSNSRFITGVEFSARDEMGKYHILGYGYDPTGASVNALVSKGHSLRFSKLKGRISFLKDEYGFEFSGEDIAQIFKLDNPGKPHLGNLMVKYGYAPSKEVAIRDYIDKAVLKSEHIGPEETINAILGSGGIPVLAHPIYGSGDQLILGDEMDERLRHLMDLGLKGVEAFYSGFSIKLIQQMLSFAEKYDLYVTAGSDYHGKNKLVQLGDTGFDPEFEIPKGMREFIRQVL